MLWIKSVRPLQNPDSARVLPQNQTQAENPTTGFYSDFGRPRNQILTKALFQSARAPW